MELLIILVLVLLNGVFAMAELALVSSRKFKLESLKKQRKLGAKEALALSENPTKFLSTVQIGITLIGVLLGVYGGKNLTDDLEQLLQKIPFFNTLLKLIGNWLGGADDNLPVYCPRGAFPKTSGHDLS